VLVDTSGYRHCCPSAVNSSYVWALVPGTTNNYTCAISGVVYNNKTYACNIYNATYTQDTYCCPAANALNDTSGWRCCASPITGNVTFGRNTTTSNTTSCCDVTYSSTNGTNTYCCTSPNVTGTLGNVSMLLRLIKLQRMFVALATEYCWTISTERDVVTLL
jgi:hypothetical protein